eukprot:g3233.t1
MEGPSDIVEENDGSDSSSYASPKDHISVCSVNSEPYHNVEVDAPSVDRLRLTESQMTDNTISEDYKNYVESQQSPDTDSTESSVDEDQHQPGSPTVPSLVEDELQFAHRSENSTPTRKSLSQAARELTLEGVSKGSEKKLARSLSGLTAEVLGDEGRAGSPLEDVRWRSQKKHYFIFSSAGKPIYSRYGDEGMLCGMMAIMQAIHSVVESKGDEVQSIKDGPVKIVFLSKGPVVLVAVSRRKESVQWMQKQLNFLYNHVLCLATGALLNVLKKNPGQDIRNLLKGSSRITEGLIQGFGVNPGLFLDAFFPIRMLKGIRQNATAALAGARKSCKAKIGFLLFGGQVVTMVQDSSTGGGSNGGAFNITDLLLLLNFVLSNELYRHQTAIEFTAPVCMPHLHETAFLHAYICFMEKDPDLVAVLLMTQPDGFHHASEARKKMEAKLRELGVVHSLKSMQLGSGIFNQGQVKMEELPLAAGGGRRELTAVQTFLFCHRSSTCPQYVLCQPSVLLNTQEAWKNLIDSLSSIHKDLSTGTSTIMQKVYWFANDKFSILYQCSNEWDLYLVCDSVTLKDHAVKIGSEITRYLLSDQLRDELFIQTSEKNQIEFYSPM